MFASKTPRDLNHDPNSWLWEDGCRLGASKATHRHNDKAWYDPRPEFDHVQHNAPNPILVAFREEIEGGAGQDRYSWGAGCMVRYSEAEAFTYTAKHFLEQVKDPARDHDARLPRICFGVDASAAQIAHARRVLTRLANHAYVEPNLCEDCAAQRYPDKVSPNEGVTHCERCGERLPEA